MREISFRWLSNQRSLNLRTVVDGPEHFDTIHASELADPTEFTSPGELLLTLGLAFEKNSEGFERYAARLASAGVRGIGFGTGLAFTQVPAELIAACRHHNVTLLEVPRATRFIAIMSAVSQEQARLNNNAQFALHRQQERLNKAATNGIGALISQASKELGAAVAVASASGTVISHRDREHLSAVSSAVDAAEQTARGAGTSTSTGATISSVFGTTGRRFALAVTRVEKFDSYSRALIRHLAGLASLLLDHPDMTAHTILGALTLDAHLAGVSTPALQAAFHMVDKHGVVDLLYVTAPSPSRLARALGELTKAEPESFVRPEHDAALIVLPPGAAQSNLWEKHARYLRVAVIHHTAWQTVTPSLVASLSAHARSLPLGTMSPFDSAAPSWLAEPGVPEALSTRRAATVDKLAAHDSRHGTELAATLRAFLVGNANLAAASAELGVHRHTVRARLDKVEELCQVDLTNPVTRAELLLLSIDSSR
ncbi:PucR family transcriptional regulator [Corynebacterium singulare]|uniref:Purine catabolism regulator-like protein n=1 Tax=Corynebacterium singulare TaxID=161899 RepID=A0A0B6EZ83_9CORY|nr:PucR family transcriptional regulator [Corynebacterium singulare]AJI78264.1 purine catabolism regulator-like protein [Corynebacterium singulare]